MLSIIMPVYNGEKTLKRAIDSILTQLYTDFELIAINDGSTDGTQKILEHFARADKRVKIINQSNCGQGEARGAALKIAAGEYVGFVDCDDEIMPDMYKTMLNCIGDSDICQCAIRDVLPNGTNNIRFNITKTVNIYDRHKFLQNYLLCSKFGFECCNKIYLRKFLTDNNIHFASNKKVYSEDLYFNLYCAMHAKKITFINEPLYVYRHSLKSHSNVKDDNTAVKMLNIFDELYTDEYKNEISRLAVLLLFVTVSSVPQAASKLVHSGNMKKYIKIAMKADMRIHYKIILFCMLYAPPFLKTIIADWYFGQKLAKFKNKRNGDN